jgi:hypothetical protein
MGWWKVQGTEHTIGDRPLDLLGDAVALVLEDYEKALKRRPTRGEWEALLEAVLGAHVSLTGRVTVASLMQPNECEFTERGPVSR